MLIFGHAVSKFNTGSFQLRGNPAGNKLETKASSHQGQCIPAGSSVSPPRRVLITLSIITMRSRLLPANSASDCLRFAKSRRNFANLVAPPTDGSVKYLVRYKVQVLP